MAKYVFELPNGFSIDLNALVKLLPGRSGWLSAKGRTRGAYIKAILSSWDMMHEAGIDNAFRLSHFFGQGLVETGFLNFRVENLNYSREGLIATFSKYRRDPDLAAQHARKPELIANTVYGGRMGNNRDGDGWKYRGRGFIQLTGRNNYERYAEASGVDIVGDPDQIANDLGKSVEVAVAFWMANNLNPLADENNGSAISRGINRGDAQSTRRANHEDERIMWAQNCLNLFRGPESVLTHGSLDDPGLMATGSRGPAVEALQDALNLLGYNAGESDGIFGPATRRALVAFQQETGLETTGLADQPTRDALEQEANDPRRTATAQDPAGVRETFREEHLAHPGQSGPPPL
ncbi:MAG: peptidoglycan-binding protein [Pseudomonadota bacterium]